MEPNNMPMNNMPVSTPPVNTPPQATVNENKSSLGSIIGTIIVISIIILGGLYFWGKRIDEAKMKQELVSEGVEIPEQESNENMEANSIKSVSNSDELDSIEADLNSTNTTNLGAELN